MLISPDTVANVLGSRKFEVIETTGVTVKNPLTMEMKELPGYVRTNYMMMARPRLDLWPW